MKFFLSIAFLSLFIISCSTTQTSIKQKKWKDLEVKKYLGNAVLITDKAEVEKMVANYKELILKSPQSYTAIINMDEIELEKLISFQDGVRFLFAAYAVDETRKTVILNIYNIRNNTSLYYDIGTLFNDPLYRRAMREQPFLCPPPLCETIIPTK